MAENSYGKTVIDIATDLLKKTQKRSMKSIVDILRKYCKGKKIQSELLATKIVLTSPGFDSIEDLKMVIGQKLYQRLNNLPSNETPRAMLSPSPNK